MKETTRRRLERIETFTKTVRTRFELWLTADGLSRNDRTGEEMPTEEFRALPEEPHLIRFEVEFVGAKDGERPAC
jgi:hypothetical protein